MTQKPLDNGGGCNDYKYLFDKVFTLFRPHTILEFGLGEGSKYLHKNCDKLYSFEITVREEQKGWADYVKSFNLPNHDVREIYFGDTYTEELERELQSIISEAKPDFVFVDSGCHARGEIVELCFRNDIFIITAHDTNHGIEKYGWNNIIIPDEYYLVNYDNGQGTKLWTFDLSLSQEIQKEILS